MMDLVSSFYYDFDLYLGLGLGLGLNFEFDFSYSNYKVVPQFDPRMKMHF